MPFQNGSYPIHKPAGVSELDGDDEVVRGLLAPVLELGRLREAVEGVVEFDGREAVGVEGQPLALGHALRVETAPPVSVLPPGGAYPEHLVDCNRRVRSTRRPRRPGALQALMAASGGTATVRYRPASSRHRPLCAPAGSPRR